LKFFFSDRLKGINILLNADEHCLGRTVEERFQVSALSISGKHCKIYRDTVLGELNRDEPVPVYLKDTRFSFLTFGSLSTRHLRLPSLLLFLKLTSCTSTAQTAHILTGGSSRKTQLRPSLIMVILYHLQHLLTMVSFCFIPPSGPWGHLFVG
jgi:hypothetical protein